MKATTKAGTETFKAGAMQMVRANAHKTWSNPESRRRITSAVVGESQRQLAGFVERMSQRGSDTALTTEHNVHSSFDDARSATFSKIGRPDSSWSDLVMTREGKGTYVVGRHDGDDRGFRVVMGPADDDQQVKLQFVWWKDGAESADKDPTFGVEETTMSAENAERVLEAYAMRGKSFRPRNRT